MIKTMATIIIVVGMIFGASCGYKFFKKFIWIGTKQGIMSKAFAYMIIGAVIGMIPGGMFLRATGYHPIRQHKIHEIIL